MEEQKNNIQQLIFKLQSSQDQIVLSALDEVRGIGNHTVIPPIVQLLRGAQNDEIRETASDILYDLKDKASVPVLMDEIINGENKKILNILVSSCWQSGLDYHDYLPVFVDLVIAEEYPLAFEALTVIENMTGHFSESIMNDQIDKLEKLKSSFSKEKQILVGELINTMKQMITPFNE